MSDMLVCDICLKVLRNSADRHLSLKLDKCKCWGVLRTMPTYSTETKYLCKVVGHVKGKPGFPWIVPCSWWVLNYILALSSVHTCNNSMKLSYFNRVSTNFSYEQIQTLYHSVKCTCNVFDVKCQYNQFTLNNNRMKMMMKKKNRYNQSQLTEYSLETCSHFTNDI